MSWSIDYLSIQAIKGVLVEAGKFDLSKKKSIALFAPNSCGKSGYADALEYLFSPDGEVQHLGKGSVDSEHGGKPALRHVLADELEIDSEVKIVLRSDDPPEIREVTRLLTIGRNDPIPKGLEDIVKIAPAHRILRQHDLRRFVVDMNPQDKYSELSRWLGLEKLTEVLSHLTTAENQLSKIDPDREFTERFKDIIEHTNNSVNSYDLPTILKWCSEQSNKYLAPSVKIDSIKELSTCIKSLQQFRNDLFKVSGAMNETLKTKTNLEKYVNDLTEDSCQLNNCEQALKNAVGAENQVDVAKAEAKESVFQEVWNSSINLFNKGPLPVCPICLTPWDKTEVGSQAEVFTYLTTSLQSLVSLKDAQDALAKSHDILKTSTRTLETYLRNLATECGKLGIKDIPPLADKIRSDFQIIFEGKTLPTHVQAEYTNLIDQSKKLIQTNLPVGLLSITIQGTPEPATDLDRLIGHLEIIQSALSRLQELENERAEYRIIKASFSLIASKIQQEAASLLNEVVTVLQAALEQLYKKIHPTVDVPHVYLKPDTSTKTLSLRIDFHKNGRTLPPAGYLSEARINTIGLALFISCAKLFNKEFPFIFLDDIVSSYDADHRARIADVVSENLADFQVIVTTHDEMFYNMLKSRLSDKGWIFDRITDWTLEQGPKRESDLLRPDQITSLIDKSDPNCGNAVRQYMEEWLDGMCGKYCAYTLHKRPPNDYDRTLFDFWGPFIDRLKKVKGNYFASRVAGQQSYQRLSAHSIINYYSHFQANPYKWPSKGDVEYVWTEFQAFTKLFQCHSCSKTLQYDRDAEKLYCTCGKEIFSP